MNQFKELLGYSINELNVGDVAKRTKKITEEDVMLFAEVSTDKNPAHTNEAYARSTQFGERIAHGILSASLISAVIGEELPGAGTIYLSQDLKFRAPVFFNDEITAVVEVLEIIEEKNRVILKTYAINQHNQVIIDGQAMVMAPKK